MSFPSPSVSVPTFTQYPSAYFNGVTFGPGPFYLQSGNFSGIWMPDVRDSNPGAPREHGSYVGIDLLGERNITLVIDVGPPYGSYSTFTGAFKELRTALSPSETTENPLFIQMTSASPVLVAMVRPQKRDAQWDKAADGGLLRKMPISFKATDPRWYGAGTLDPSVDVPAPLGGFSFDMAFNLSFGGGSEAGTITATNAGDMYAFPIITFTGPCTYPTITNASLSNNPYLQFAVGMNSGDTLIVNTDPKYPSAVYYTSGSSVGVDFLYTLTSGSNWFGLQPGTNTLQFTTKDASQVAGYVTCEYPPGAYSAAA